MAAAPRLAPGTIFARDYEIIDLLAEGGMGAVYRAEQRSTRKVRALKLVNSRLASDPKGRERFIREATVGASIDSEHVVEVIGAGVDEGSGRPWLAMELLDGADLGAVLRHQGPLTFGQLREVIGQLCHGLASAHRAGVVHRDLKPANIFIARSRRAGVPFTVKILDFGIAKVVQESGSGATDTDTVGSPLWMAPEQLNAQRPTPGTDVWALGLLAFWALTGKHYWLAAHAESSTVQALFVEQLFKPFDLATLRAQELGSTAPLPDGFDPWFALCTHRDPPRRYIDAWTAGEALRALLPEDPAAAARLLPDVALRPSVSDTTAERRTGTETTLASQGAAPWEASSVVTAATLAAARSSFEGESTRAGQAGLGADLSRGPLPGGPARPPSRSGASPLTVMLSVALVAGLLAGGGFLVWKWRQPSPPIDSANVAATTTPPSTEGTTTGAEDVAGSSDGGEPPPTSRDAGSDRMLTPLLAPDVGSSTDGDDDPMLDLVVPLRTQVDAKIHDMRFLGWSEAGHRFVLQVQYRDERKHATNRLTLIEVHDALTGEMIESFLVSRDAEDGVSRYNQLTKAAAEARPNADWPDHRAAMKMQKQAPERGPAAGGTLHIESEDAPPGTTITFPRSPLGVAFRWSTTVPPGPGAPKRKAPPLAIDLEQGDERFTLLRLEPPFSHARLATRLDAGTGEGALAGRVLAFWSPDASRVVLMFSADLRPPGDDPGVHHRWALRAAGPQIRLVEAGAGQRKTRRIAQRLAAAGLTVAQAELRAPPEATSRLVARKRDGASALAERVRAVLPELPEPVSERRRKDYASVVVVLGQDAH